MHLIAIETLVFKHAIRFSHQYVTHGSTQLRRIQRFINFCARVVSGRKKYNHIVRCQTMNCASSSVCSWLVYLPPDIAAMFTHVEHIHGTRQKGQLRVPRARNNSGLRRFSVRSTKLYNKLPGATKSQSRLHLFKEHLKRHMLRDTNWAMCRPVTDLHIARGADPQLLGGSRTLLLSPVYDCVPAWVCEMVC